MGSGRRRRIARPVFSHSYSSPQFSCCKGFHLRSLIVPKKSFFFTIDSMNQVLLLLVLLCICLICTVDAFIPVNRFQSILTKETASSSALYAHHVQRKVIKKIMHRRPKKKRLSDIHRNNQNMDKCINHVPGAPDEYTLLADLTAEDHMNLAEEARRFWEVGDPNAPWIEITEADRELAKAIPQNIEPLPVGGVQKRPPLVKSGSC